MQHRMPGRILDVAYLDAKIKRMANSRPMIVSHGSGKRLPTPVRPASEVTAYKISNLTSLRLSRWVLRPVKVQ